MRVHPLDLLHLARTSKRVRAILMARSNRYIWAAAFTCIQGLPGPPSFLNEPQYAMLLFESVCSQKVHHLLLLSKRRQALTRSAVGVYTPSHDTGLSNESTLMQGPLSPEVCLASPLKVYRDH